MATQQSDVAVSYANQVQALVAQLCQLRATLGNLVTVNANNPLGNLWNALYTTALNSDGTLGTSDGATPNASHVIDPRTYPALGRVEKATDLENGLAVLVSLNNFLAGQAIAAAGATPAFLDALGM